MATPVKPSGYRRLWSSSSFPVSDRSSAAAVTASTSAKIEQYNEHKLLAACRSGDVNQVRELLGQDASLLHQEFRSGNPEEQGMITPLFLACQEGHIDIVKLLLAQKADINRTALDGMAPLAVASAGKHIEIVKLLLQQADVDVNLAGGEKQTALGVASAKGYNSIVRLLLACRRVDVNKATDDGINALHCAVTAGHRDVVAVLLTHLEIDVNAANKKGVSPLLMATNLGQTGIVELLLKKPDINIYAQDDEGCTALYRACQRNQRDILVRLVSSEERYGDQSEQSRFRCALLKPNLSQLKQLLAKQPSLAGEAFPVYHGSTAVFPLCVALENQQQAVVRQLLNQGVDVNVTDADGATPLNLAKKYGTKAIEKLLLAKGARLQPEQKDVSQTTAAPLAADADADHVTESATVVSPDEPLLMPDTPQEYKKEDEFLAACRTGNLDKLQALLAKKPFLAHQEFLSGRVDRMVTPLSLACQEGHKEVVSLLLKQGVNANKYSAGDKMTALGIAAHKGHTDIVRLLLESKNIDVNKSLHHGMAPLHIAAFKGYSDIVGLLLKSKNIDVNKDYHDELPPLHIAVLRGHTDIVEQLLAVPSINLLKKDKFKGRTALALAHGYNKREMVIRLARAEGGYCEQSDLQVAFWQALIASNLSWLKELVRENPGLVPKVFMVRSDGEIYYPLLSASRHNRKGIVALLLTHGMDVNGVNEKGVSALRMAAEFGKSEIVELLLQHPDIDVNTVGKKNITPLFVAAQNGHPQVVAMLLARGADPNIKWDMGLGASRSPLEAASHHNRDEVVQILLAAQSATEHTPLL